MLTYSYLRYFWAVAHDGNLTRAATRLHVSQSAVSVQIRKLEEELGRPLFARKGRQLLLTDAGRIALEYADSIFALGDRLTSALGTSRQPSRRTLRVGALATLSRNFQLSFVTPLLRRPDITLALRSGSLPSLLRELRDHRLDVLLTNVLPPRDTDVPWLPQQIADEPVALVGHRRRVKKRRAWTTMLATEPLILPSPDSALRGSIDALLDSRGIEPRVVAEVDDMAMIRLLVRENAGLAVLPPIVVRDELSLGVLQEVSRLPGIRETFYAVTLKRAVPDPLLTEVLADAGRR
jgi:LysR family transcriptional activator of nhaA